MSSSEGNISAHVRSATGNLSAIVGPIDFSPVRASFFLVNMNGPSLNLLPLIMTNTEWLLLESIV